MQSNKQNSAYYYYKYGKNTTDHFVELNLSIQICLYIVAEVSDTVFMEMLCLGHQAVRDDVSPTFRFLQFLITYFARILLVMQFGHYTLTSNTATLHITVTWFYMYNVSQKNIDKVLIESLYKFSGRSVQTFN